MRGTCQTRSGMLNGTQALGAISPALPKEQPSPGGTGSFSELRRSGASGPAISPGAFDPTARAVR